ncbi:MAG: Lrp/AsnC family transcriptional regulator [Pseudomonadota bacterium]
MSAVLDDLDRKILAELQADSSRSLDDIARLVGASKTPVWNRIRKMREAGVIKRQMTLLDPEALGLNACFFVMIKTSEHDAGWLERFLNAVSKRPEVVEAYRMAGEIDYILKVRVPDAKAYDAFYRDLISEVSIFNVSSALAMEEIKSSPDLPIPPAPPRGSDKR